MIRVDGLTKQFGSTVAVDDLSFEAHPGRVTGLLGPNGSGKTTTFRLLVGLDRPTSGSARINGQRYGELEAPLREVGTLIDPTAVHGGRRADRHLQWLAKSTGIAASRVDEVLDLVGLSSVADWRVGRFSSGMAQRLGLASALLGDPEVLILDEPSVGLDTDGIRWVRGLVRSLAADGRTVLMASHLMDEIERTVDDVIVVAEGRLVAAAPLGELTADRGSLEQVYVELAEGRSRHRATDVRRPRPGGPR